MAKNNDQVTIPTISVQLKKKGGLYYRIQTTDSNGKKISVYGKSEEEVRKKYINISKEIEKEKTRRLFPTVKEYCEKWLIMQAAHLQENTLRGYTNSVYKYIVAPLGDKYMSEITADDLKMAMIPVSKLSADTFNRVHMLVKSIFYSAEYSNILDDNPAKYLNAKGGKPSESREPLSDNQVSALLETVKDIPPYVFVMLGIYAGLRREEILALEWDCVFLDTEVPYISVRRVWRTVHGRPTISTVLKTPSAKRDIPIPKCLVECLKNEKERSNSDFVVSDSQGNPLSESQYTRLWQYIKVRTAEERTIYKYINGQKITKKINPELGDTCQNNGNIKCSLDFHVTPHRLRHTYITNLVAAGVDPKTVQYLAGHKNSKVTMDIYAKVKYNRPEQLSSVVNVAFK